MSDEQNTSAIYWLLGYTLIVGTGLSIARSLRIHPAEFFLFLAGLLIIRHIRASQVDQRLALLLKKIEQLELKMDSEDQK
ncbi:MAG: hypothetical protein HQ519_02455 [Planctomycetes bacterium]|nr:hypothetical protein [Planctomycetota bacterium]